MKGKKGNNEEEGKKEICRERDSGGRLEVNKESNRIVQTKIEK